MNIDSVTYFLEKDAERMATDLRSKYQASMADFKIESVLDIGMIYDDHQKAKESIKRMYTSIHAQIMEHQIANPDCLLLISNVTIHKGEKIRMVVDCISVDIRNQRKRVLESALIKMAANLLKD